MLNSLIALVDDGDVGILFLFLYGQEQYVGVVFDTQHGMVVAQDHGILRFHWRSQKDGRQQC